MELAVAAAALGFLKLIAFLIFFRSVAGPRPQAQDKEERIAGLKPAPKQGDKIGKCAWVMVVVGGTIGLLLALRLNLIESTRLGLSGASPSFPPEFDLRFLVLSTWGFLVPFVWAFMSRWMPAFLGLKPPARDCFLRLSRLSAAILSADMPRS